jgi:TM2 domain-containing membrane protein YozV
MTGVSCPECRQKMALLDGTEQRYYCYSDDVVYLGAENRWIGVGEPLTASPPTQSGAKSKSMGAAFLLNFLLFAGAGLMYAGQWVFGVLYLVVALFFVFVYPNTVIALIVAILSYVHTYFAVENFNTKAQQLANESGTGTTAFPKKPSVVSPSDRNYCIQCGKSITPSLSNCAYCRAALPKLSDETVVY